MHTQQLRTVGRQQPGWSWSTQLLHWPSCRHDDQSWPTSCANIHQLPAERHLPGRECGITALPALRVTGRSHRAGDATYNNGRRTAPSQHPISGCLQTFTENSLLYLLFLLTFFFLLLLDHASWQCKLVKCPWSKLFIRDTLKLTNLHYITVWQLYNILFNSNLVKHFTEKNRYFSWQLSQPQNISAKNQIPFTKHHQLHTLRIKWTSCSCCVNITNITFNQFSWHNACRYALSRPNLHVTFWYDPLTFIFKSNLTCTL